MVARHLGGGEGASGDSGGDSEEAAVVAASGSARSARRLLRRRVSRFGMKELCRRRSVICPDPMPPRPGGCWCIICSSPCTRKSFAMERCSENMLKHMHTKSIAAVWPAHSNQALKLLWWTTGTPCTMEETAQQNAAGAYRGPHMRKSGRSGGVTAGGRRQRRLVAARHGTVELDEQALVQVAGAALDALAHGDPHRPLAAKQIHLHRQPVVQQRHQACAIASVSALNLAGSPPVSTPELAC